ncbi:MAG: hypothetical protein JRJ03_16555 [Deltaproteobacteria bacterium]|nr:hypothetical protein [Deltaproteobacteria bacterium]
MNIYGGNLSYQATEDDLKAAFSRFGEVTSVFQGGRFVIK